MPVPIVTALIDRVSQALGITVWDGEVPRQNTQGEEITVDLPADLVVDAFMSPSGLNYEATMEDAFSETGIVTVELWCTTRKGVDAALQSVFTLLAKNWDQIPVPSPAEVYHLVLSNFYSGQEQGVRTKKSQLLYRGTLNYEVGIHGEVSTR